MTANKTKTAIVLFTYARLHHTQRTVAALLDNQGVEEHDLIVFSDAARSSDKLSAVTAVRDYLKTISGFRTVSIHHRAQNYGLAKSIIEGVTEVLTKYERVIVLEDDMVTSPYFLRFMNDALDRYELDEQVISVHGYVYPTTNPLPETFFLRGADCWGWATWQRGWKFFNPDGSRLLSDLKKQKLIKGFDFNNSYGFSEMLERQIKGENDSWAVRWYASAFLANKLTLYPGNSLVQNIGCDSSGTHCDEDNSHNVTVSNAPITFGNIEVKESETARAEFEKFFLSVQPTFALKVKRWLTRLYGKLTWEI